MPETGTETITSAGTDESQTAETQGASNETVSGFDVDSIFDTDGKFVENWKQTLPEELRGEKSLDTFSDFPGAVKMFVNAQKKIGMGKVVIPTDKSSQEDWDAYYKAGGRPEKAEDYKIEVPQGLEPMYPQPVIDRIRKFAFENGINQKTVANYMKFEGELATEFKKMNEEAETTKANADFEEFIKRWGPEDGPRYKEQKAIVQLLLRDYMHPDDKDKIEEAINTNPYFADLLAGIGKKFVEAKMINPDAESSGNIGILDKIRTLRATVGYADGSMQRNNRAEFDRITEELKSMYEKAYPEKGSR
jgi:hypothetical protein